MASNTKNSIKVLLKLYIFLPSFEKSRVSPYVNYNFITFEN